MLRSGGLDPRYDLPELYRDEHLCVVAKPAGLLVHRGWGDDRVVAMTLLRNRLGQHVYPVHRLDRPTSGVLIFALDSGVAAAMAKRFEQGEVQKTYLALCRGVPAPELHIDYPIPNKEGGERVPAVTYVALRFATERYALLEVWPRTGRLHQIRRHLKHLSHPLIGDVRYGHGEHNRLFREQHGLFRLALHALAIAFPHPITSAPLALRAKIPDDLRRPLRSLGVPEALLLELEAGTGPSKPVA